MLPIMMRVVNPDGSSGSSPSYSLLHWEGGGGVFMAVRLLGVLLNSVCSLWGFLSFLIRFYVKFTRFSCPTLYAVTLLSEGLLAARRDQRTHPVLWDVYENQGALEAALSASLMGTKNKLLFCHRRGRGTLSRDKILKGDKSGRHFDSTLN